jgi:hypothetical protein
VVESGGGFLRSLHILPDILSIWFLAVFVTVAGYSFNSLVGRDGQQEGCFIRINHYLLLIEQNSCFGVAENIVADFGWICL